MRYIVLAIITILKVYSCSGQMKSKAWLPEKYVDAIIEKDTNAYKYLIPVEGFQFSNNEWHILMYRSELNPFKKIAVSVEGQRKHKIPYLDYSIDLMENPKSLVDNIATSQVYFSRSGQKILLEIVNKDEHQKNYFIDRLGKYEFEELRTAKDSLIKAFKYSGRY